MCSNSFDTFKIRKKTYLTSFEVLYSSKRQWNAFLLSLAYWVFVKYNLTFFFVKKKLIIKNISKVNFFTDILLAIKLFICTNLMERTCFNRMYCLDTGNEKNHQDIWSKIICLLCYVFKEQTLEAAWCDHVMQLMSSIWQSPKFFFMK